MSIHLKDGAPVSSRPIRLEPIEKDFVEKRNFQMAREKGIRKITSRFSSPIVLAKKKGVHFDSGLIIAN